MNEITITFSGWYEDHRKFKTTFTKGITTVVGKNGSGKSSMIHEIKNYCEENEIPCYYYEQREMGDKTRSEFLMGGNAQTSIAYSMSSEGERIIVSIGNKIANIKRFLNNHKCDEIVFLLFDGLDSGLSINGIRDLCWVFDMLLKDYPNVAIINTTNNYEFIRDSRCVIAKNGRDISLKSYDDFVKFILKQDKADQLKASKK